MAVYRHAAAVDDLIEHAVHLAIEAWQEVGDRFLVNAEKSFEMLASLPKIGAPVILEDPRFGGMRKWAIKEFDRYLIF